MKRILTCIFVLLAVGSSCVHSQSKDNLEYARALFAFSKQCRNLGLFDHSLVTAGVSSQILEKQKENASTFDEKYMICKNLIDVNNFIIDLTSGRKKDLYPMAMMPELTSMSAAIEITTECMKLITEAVETGDNATIDKMKKYLNSIPVNTVSYSAYLWQNDDMKGALEEIDNALKDNPDKITIEQKNLLQKRRKALSILRNASKKNVDQCMLMAEELYYPLTLSQLLYDQRLPDYYLVLRYTARLYEQYKNPQKALSAYERIYSLLVQQMKDDLPYLLPSEKSALWGFMQSYFDEMQQFACKHHAMPGAAEFLYNVTLLKKEIFEVTSLNFIRYLTESKDNEIDRLMAKRDLLIRDENTYKTSLSDDFINAFKNAVQIVNLERTIVDRLKKTSNSMRKWHCQWDDIVSTLSPQEAVVEIINLQRADSWVYSDYWAIVFKGGDVSPQLVYLFPASELVGYFYGDKAYEKIWKPMEEKIKGCSEVYMAFEGYLNTYSLGEIKVGDSYLCDKYDFHYLMSTKDIISSKSAPMVSQVSQRDIILFGGAEFGLPISETADSKRGQGFAYLSGTVKEVNEISKLLSEDKWKVHKYMGKAATEKAFKELSGKPFSSGILHISTHGFNLRYDRSITNHAIQTNGKSGFYEPLLRTGFALTGANEAWTGEHPMDGTDDGIVTAFEIADLNLKNIDLVVLSTCQSGLGEIREGEGLLGMPRAFRMAGVRNILVTLDDVSDKETADFMILFYSLWQETKNIHQAFVQTQRQMKNMYPESFNSGKWANFKLIE